MKASEAEVHSLVLVQVRLAPQLYKPPVSSQQSVEPLVPPLIGDSASFACDSYFYKLLQADLFLCTYKVVFF